MLPTMMTCVLFDAPGGPETLRLGERPVPKPGAGELLIRVEAAGVNRPDLFQRQGLYPPPAGASPILGLEVSGTVVASGADTPDGMIGRKLCALVNGGGYAEFVAVAAGQCLRIPAGLSMAEAACLPETSFTVWHNLFERGRLGLGKTALIHGGSSGIGTTAIQYGHALGARMFATAGSAEKCAACVELGAEAAINYRTQDFAAELLRLTGGAGVDVVLDMVGAPYLERNLSILAEDGTLVFIAFLGGAVAHAVPLGSVQRKRLTITGSTLRPQTGAAKAAIASGLRRVVWPLLDAGLARPVLHARFPLARAADAHAMLEQGEHIGKVVLIVADPLP